MVFCEIMDCVKWQKIQDHFSEVLGVTIVTINRENKFITSPSNPLYLCNEVLKTNPKSPSQCKQFIPQDLSKFSGNWKEGIACPFGLRNFFVPVNIKKEIVSYLWVGPVVLGGRPDDEWLRGKAFNMNIDPDKFIYAFKEIKVFSFYNMRSIVEFLHDISSYLIQLEYQNMELRNIKPKFIDVFSKVYTFYVDKLFGALLDVSFSFMGADRGSVMFLDEKSQELYIKKAKGISKDIIENTRIGLGEGIAGMVAKERKPLFIDDTVTDERIVRCLHRPQIESSLSVPIEIKDKVLGVLNVATLSSSSEKFSKDSIGTIKNLIKLIDSTLRDIPAAEFS